AAWRRRPSPASRCSFAPGRTCTGSTKSDWSACSFLEVLRLWQVLQIAQTELAQEPRRGAVAHILLPAVATLHRDQAQFYQLPKRSERVGSAQAVHFLSRHRLAVRNQRECVERRLRQSRLPLAAEVPLADVAEGGPQHHLVPAFAQLDAIRPALLTVGVVE